MRGAFDVDMMAKRDHAGVFGLGEGSGRDAGTTGEEHQLVRRPIPSVLDTRLGGGAAAAQAMSRMTSPTPDQGFQNLRNNTSSHVTRPGVGRPPWMMGKLQADSGSEDNSTITLDNSSPKKEVTEAPSTSAWDRPAPMSNRREDSALAQQARKAAFMYGGPLQALRANVARASALGDEAHPGAHMTVGREPSSSHSALPFHSKVNQGNSRFENEGATVAAGHASLAGTGKLPCTAQLTVFYAGMVNVYEDVPADKAQAIMLLAGTGSGWSSSNYTSFLGSAGANPGRPFPTPGDLNHPMSRAGSPAPPHLPTQSAGPALTKSPNRQVTTAVELPQARKASLARFLEKRKDRVRKGPYTHPNDEAAKSDALRRNSRENSPSHASGNPPRRSLSPPAAAGNDAKNGSQPRTPPRQSVLDDRSHGTLVRKESENSNVDAMVARGEKSSPSR